MKCDDDCGRRLRMMKENLVIFCIKAIFQHAGRLIGKGQSKLY
jgi:hypothetical protein